MKKESVSKVLISVMWVMILILSFYMEMILFIPAFIYGLINGISFKSIFKTFWIEGYFESLKKIYKTFEEEGL